MSSIKIPWIRDDICKSEIEERTKIYYIYRDKHYTQQQLPFSYIRREKEETERALALINPILKVKYNNKGKKGADVDEKTRGEEEEEEKRKKMEKEKEEEERKEREEYVFVDGLQFNMEEEEDEEKDEGGCTFYGDISFVSNALER